MRDEPRLRRDIGLTGSAFLSFNGMVGAGIFALPGVLHAQFGSLSPWLFPIFGLLTMLLVIPFARLASLYPGSGGPVAYVAPFGAAAVFQVGWLYYVARLTAYAANANVFASYAGALWPRLASPGGRAAVILLLVGSVTWLNVIGVRRAVRALDVLTLFKALPLVALALWGLTSAPAVAAPIALPASGALAGVALVIFYAFIGFENSVVPAGETKDPQRTIPRALIVTVAGTAVLYCLVQLAYTSVMPAGAQPAAPLAALAEALIGTAGVTVLSVTAMASVAGNSLGSTTSTPRVTFALAHQGLLPPILGAVHARWQTPVNSVLFMGVLGAALALTGSFVWLAVVSTLARLFVYGASIAALPGAVRASGRRAGRAVLLSVAGGLLICVWAAAQSRLESWAMLAGLFAVGLLLYAYTAARRPRRSG